ncbi:hypothetical protein Y1Q_0002803 [Alligator mississippiensis]|uniref:Uncharacterized protein n=1 Tax=Alligator mississippiensis TaxID=8496 RepID=A0A151NZF8_ALLMI|nr:hypothetical protein Y1Q_0002803 [Alligator mississippiensis]
MAGSAALSSHYRTALHYGIRLSRPADQGNSAANRRMQPKIVEPEAVESSPPAQHAKSKRLHCPSAF